VTARVILICHGSTEAVRAAKFPMDEPLDDHALKSLTRARQIGLGGGRVVTGRSGDNNDHRKFDLLGAW
jgi:hypothetical protein